MSTSDTYSKLRDILTTKILNAGVTILPPVTTHFKIKIDIWANTKDEQFLFKIVVLSGNQVTQKLQLYDAMSQLYEYSYLENLGNAALIMLLEQSLHNQPKWMNEFLEKDRQIKLIWDGDGKLYASPQTQRELAFLW
jgi:hypothetical protein